MSNDRRSARLRHQHDLADLDLTGLTLAITSLTPAGTTAQFLRGDLTWNNTLTGVLNISAGGAQIVGATRITQTSSALQLKGAGVANANTTYLEFLDSANSRTGYLGDESTANGDIGLSSAAGHVNVYANNTLNARFIGGTNEMLRLVKDGAFLSFYNTAEAARTGYLQMDTTNGGFLIVEVNKPLEVRTNNAAVVVWAAAGQGTHKHPLLIETSGSAAADRNTEMKTAGQSNVAFGTYAGVFRPVLTIQSETNAHHISIVGPEAAGGSNHAQIYTTRALITRAQDHRFQNIAGTNLATVESSGEVWAANGFRTIVDSGNTYLYSTNSAPATYPHGSWRIAGNAGGGGYVGLINDAPLQPTFMSRISDGLTGVYFQGPGRWAWYDDGAKFRVTQPIVRAANDGAYTGYNSSSFQSGIITVQSGGTASGGADGDQFLIY